MAADDDRLEHAYSPAVGRYDDVAYTRTGASGVLLPRISLGLWQNFGRDRPQSRAREILRHAFDRGITHIDLANNYGPPYGAAETTFGDVLRSDLRPYRDELFLATKAGYDMWPGPYGDGGSRKYLVRSLEQSLKRMSTDYVDVFYSHRPDPETPLEETAQALADIVRSGKALYVGISNYPALLARRVYELLAHDGVRLLVHQPRYSLFDRTPEADLFPLLGELGVGAAVFSPLAQGLLTTKYLDGMVPNDSRAANSRFLSGTSITDAYLQRIRGISRIADSVDLSIAQLALAWVLRPGAVTTAIIGASRPEQIDEAITASASALPEQVLDELDEFAAPIGEAVH